MRIADEPFEDRDRIDAGFREIFDGLFQRGRVAVTAGSHFRDESPTEGGRWGMSAAFRFDEGSAARLGDLTGEVMELAGPDHWPTGAPHAAHLTVRAIQVHRAQIPPADPLALRCAQAMVRTTARLGGPVVLRLEGVTLTPSGVMACAYPVDSAAGAFAAGLREELGVDGRFEEEYVRNIWYVSLVHFSGAIRDPAGLIDWVADRRNVKCGDGLAERAQLLTFRHDGHQPVPVALADIALPEARVGAPTH